MIGARGARGRRPGELGSPGGGGLRAGRWAGGIVLLAAAVRFWRLDGFALGFDEAISVRCASADSLRAVWGIAPARARLFTDAYNSLLHAWMALGSDPATIRALSACLSVVALVLAWRILRGLLPAGWALTALALFAFAPLQVQHAQEARPYALVLVLEFAATLALVRAVTHGERVAWAAWAFGCALAGASHLLALSWIAASAVYVWLLPGARRSLAPLAGWGLAAAAPAIVLAVADARGIGHMNATSLAIVPAQDFLLGIDQYFGPYAWVPEPLVGPALVAWGALAVAGVCLAAAPTGTGYGDRRLRAAVVAFGLVPLVLVLAGNWAGIVYRPKPRYAMGAQLFLVAAGVRALMAVPWPPVRAVVLAGLLASDAASLVRYFGHGIPTLDLPPCKKPFHEVAADLIGRARPGDGVLSCYFWTFLPLDYHLGGRLAHGYVLGDPIFAEGELRMLGFPSRVEAFLRAHRRVWVVTAPANWTEPTDVPEDVLVGLQRVAVLREEALRPGIRIQRWEARHPSAAGPAAGRREIGP